MAGPRKRPARGRASLRTGPLSAERIVDAALALVERDGLEAFSARRLGQELGCEAMSIYHFFRSKQHLTDALVERAIGSVEFPDESLPPLERLGRLMHAYRAMAHRHARLFPLVAVHRLNTRVGVSFIERLLGVFRDALDDDELAARYFRVAGYYLMGAGLDETSGYAKGPSAAEPVDDKFVARECPQLARSARYFQRKEWDATFDLGVAALLEAIRRARRRG